MLFKLNKFFDLKLKKKKKKNIIETSYLKTDITENICACCEILTIINQFMSNFQFFFCMLQVKSITL